jgi:hypothetical protein
MKNLLLFSLVILFITSGFAQKRSPSKAELLNTPAVRHYAVPADIPPPALNHTFTTPGVMKAAVTRGEETEIIETVFDLQSNATIANRFIVWDDGTMAAVATYGIENPTNYAFPDRGTAYNYFDGSSWGPKPMQRIESVRTGWPSIAPLGANGEIVVSHISGTTTLKVLHRTEKGTGAWIEEDFPPAPAGASGLLWPRIITSGTDNNIVHVFAVTAPEGNNGVIYEGQDGALLYYRSTDAAQTWDIQGVILDGLGSDYYNSLSSDNYTLASHGDMVVVLNGGAWNDMFIMKSMDNGDTWEKIMIWEHPYPFFDFDVTLMDDTLYSVDNSANMAIDPNGMVHVVWGISRVARLAAAPPEPGFYSYWPYTDGIGYWNEAMGQIPEADNPHHTMMPENLDEMGMIIGHAQGDILAYEGTGNPYPFAVYRSLGISTMPTITIKGSMITLAFATPTHEFLTTDGIYNYHHIWLRSSYDLGQTWGDFYDLVGGNVFHLYDECIYPVLASNPNADGLFQLIYNADNKPGIFAFADEHEPVINRIIHHNIDYTVNVGEATGKFSALGVSQNYPNPAGDITHINIDLSYQANVIIDLFNLTGQKIKNVNAGMLQPGSHQINLNVSGLTEGIYFYTVTAENEQVTRKMVVN